MGDEPFVCIRFCSAQLVVEMDDRKYDAEFLAQFEHDSQEAYGVGPAGNGDSYAIASTKKALTSDVGEDALGQGGHGNIVHLGVGGLLEWSSALALH